MKKIISILIGLAVNFLFSATVFAKISPQETNKIISKAVNWFKIHQEDNGHFNYEYIPYLKIYANDDHIVRQAGAIYVLSEVLRYDTQNQYELKSTIEKSLAYMEQNSTKDNYKDYDFTCLKIKEKRCTLGGTSLALISIINLTEKYPELETKYQNLTNGYLNFVLAMRKSNYGFQANFYLTESQSDTESDFDSGEAFLALSKAYRKNKDPELKKIIDKSFTYFKKTYSKEWSNNFHLWGMAALKTLKSIDQTSQYFQFAKDYTDWRIEQFESKKTTSNNVCAYIEGLISGYIVIKDELSADEKNRYLEEIDFWLTKSKKLQIKVNDRLSMKLNNEKAEKVVITKNDKAIGGFLNGLRSPMQRIDYTQHCLSSYLQNYTEVDGAEF